ncbi:GNAT family acetyltransferase-like protein [Leptotrombidium deliense]|uniref:GNAT family acetyltransferase-like protein n=1 Tax=Leptotrombidium deliense TaxID=299467 RepID=A0A443SAX2_9ACAR|nr:GNAT family acetyltransferase-like protein [Leptotrombidium deliense]
MRHKTYATVDVVAYNCKCGTKFGCNTVNTGKVIGACAGPRSTADIAFIGLYCVHKDYQGLGLGLKLFKKVREELGDINIGLGAVPSQISTYRDKAGFTVEDKTRMIVFEGKVTGLENLTNAVDGVSVVSICDSLMPQVIDYDESITKYRRDAIIQLTCTEPLSISMAAVRKENNSDIVLGFGCVKRSNIDEVIMGPLYANNDLIAEVLITSLINSFPPAVQHGLIIFALNGSIGALTIPEKLGLERKEEVPRLYTKSVPDADVSRIYSILTPNFSPY